MKLTVPLINKELEQEYKDSQEFINMIKGGFLYENDKIFYPSYNPRITIVLPVHNGENFVKETLLSIQNQDFKDVEIIIIDDQSTDKSVNVIKEIMKTEPRISLYQNKKNKGILYTKTKGVSLAKGEYVMIIDDDDKYLQRETFTMLYSEAKKYNLDILGFKTLLTTSALDKEEFKKTKNADTKIIHQNELSNFVFSLEKYGITDKNINIKVNQFIKTDLFKRVIEEIDIKYLNEKINYYDDFLLFFFLTRNAKSFKHLNRIFYLKEKITFGDNPKINYRKREKLKDFFNLSCFAYLNIIEILFNKTKNTFEDKKIVFSLFENLYLNNLCRKNTKHKEKALIICDLFIKSEYII